MTDRRRWELLREDLRRFSSGEALENVVDKAPAGVSSQGFTWDPGGTSMQLCATLLAAVSFDQTGAARIGKWLLA